MISHLNFTSKHFWPYVGAIVFFNQVKRSQGLPALDISSYLSESEAQYIPSACNTAEQSNKQPCVVSSTSAGLSAPVVPSSINQMLLKQQSVLDRFQVWFNPFSFLLSFSADKKSVNSIYALPYVSVFSTRTPYPTTLWPVKFHYLPNVKKTHCHYQTGKQQFII